MGKMDFFLQVLSIVPYIFKGLLTVLRSISLWFSKRILKFLPCHSLL